ncbi:MAG: hypothetical protein ACLUEK_10170 [Oscillospiraceae bacterium]
MTNIDKAKLAYYRTFQGVFGVGEKFMPWRKPELVTGAGSIREIPRLLAEAGVKKVLLAAEHRQRPSASASWRYWTQPAELRGVLGGGGEPSVTTAERIYERYRTTLRRLYSRSAAAS